MSVFYDRQRGRWVAVLDIGPHPVSGKRRRRKVTACTQVEAERLLLDLATRHEQPCTVGQVLAAVLREPPATWRRPNTLKLNRQYAARLARSLGAVLVADLTPAQVDACLAVMPPTSGYSAWCLLRLALRRAQPGIITAADRATWLDTYRRGLLVSQVANPSKRAA